MYTPSGRIAAACLALWLAVGVVAVAGPNRGQPIDPAAIGAWDISVPPDGTGLPPGAGIGRAHV